ncbi:MAG: hypothetical protein A3J28_10420 [Acidobacteria bacterium RIFCSPLOWO2_12_FULL_60_22]|nr:MAG: hypothetical protein A3J28_10420 [Acidobacteria bacterium RIFCSPLOWO2_12_FULL_60_22]
MAAQKKDAALIELVLNESMRQDLLVHEWGTSLGTKTALYMVFVGFVVTAETEIAKLAAGPFASALLGMALFFSLLGLLPLLFAAFLYHYKKPPRPTRLREQFLELDKILAKEGVAEGDRILTMKEKLGNSYSRCIDENLSVNERIANKLELSSIFLGLAIGMLLILALIISVQNH